MGSNPTPRIPCVIPCTWMVRERHAGSILGIILACAILIFLALGLTVLVVLLALDFLLFGIELVALGAVGRGS